MFDGHGLERIDCLCGKKTMNWSRYMLRSLYLSGYEAIRPSEYSGIHLSASVPRNSSQFDRRILGGVRGQSKGVRTET